MPRIINQVYEEECRLFVLDIDYRLSSLHIRLGIGTRAVYSMRGASCVRIVSIFMGVKCTWMFVGHLNKPVTMNGNVNEEWAVLGVITCGVRLDCILMSMKCIWTDRLSLWSAEVFDLFGLCILMSMKCIWTDRLILWSAEVFDLFGLWCCHMFKRIWMNCANI